ncbi:MAG TPA: class I SAM-dependent methyltransferase [Candidatus Binatia bacterium]|nr:class I SAM-dependent methyltransferase [Candidatus Binatia bacterium]
MRARLYDLLIVPLTSSWYDAVLGRLPAGSRLLDVGIGTGGALLAHADRLRRQDLSVIGVDIDADYVAHCAREIERHGVADRVAVCLESIYDHHGGPYDAAYFSGSFMLLPDPPAAVRHVATLLAPGGYIYFTQTFEHERSRVLEVVKPMLRRITTVDFGRVTYEADFERALAAAGGNCEERVVLHAGRRRSALLLAVRVREGMCAP